MNFRPSASLSGVRALALLGVGGLLLAGVAGCEKTTASSTKRSYSGAYASTNEDGTREFVLLKPDGTYQHAVVDRYRKVYVNEGTWQKYGTSENRNRVGADRVELRNWADSSDTLRYGSARKRDQNKVLPGDVFSAP